MSCSVIGRLPDLWQPQKGEVYDKTNVSTQQLAPQAASWFSLAHGDEGRAGDSIAAAVSGTQEIERLRALFRSRRRAMQTLKTRAHFQRVQKGRKWVAPAFILHGLPRDNSLDPQQMDEPRFGFTVSSKAVAQEGAAGLRRGRAVDRNRARRRLKEAVRLAAPSFALPNFDYVVIGRKAALDIKFAELLADMQLAFHKVQQARTSEPGRPLRSTSA